jgi:uncharacterized protein (TIGR00369 family)
MTEKKDSFPGLPAAFQEILGEQEAELLIPPPAFRTMEGEFLHLDLEEGLLQARFPVKNGYLNPYGSLQGGFTAAAIDNTIGPLSMLVAPPNLTRRLEITYSEPARPETGRITVSAHFLDQDGRWLYFQADVRDPAGKRLARAKATHWILESG